MNDDIITNKILESGFIEAFFDNYYYLKDDKISSYDRLDFDLCISKKEKIKLAKKKLKECNEIIKKSAYSDIGSDFIRDYKSFKSEKEEIKVFSNYYKNSITSFEPITNFFSYYDNSVSFQNFYKYNYPEYLKPNIIDVEDICRQEERILNFLLETIEDFEINQIWEIDFNEINFLKDYSIPIKNLIDLAELYFQIKRMFIYRELIKESENNILTNNDVVTFSKALENFFIQTNYCLTLNPETVLLSEKGNISLVLEPQQFFKIINDYQIDYPFVIESKIQELKNLMIKDNISIKDGISIFESYKKHYNPIDSVLIFQPILDLLDKGLKRINPLITINEITKEHILLDNFYIGIKKDFHNIMYDGLFNFGSVVLNNEEVEINSIDVIKANKIELLKTIWLPNAQITIEDFIQKGIDKGMWNEKFDIIPQRNSMYASGKKMLAAVYVAFKNWAINGVIDYKIVGKVLCEVFNVKIKETTKEPFKSFSSANKKVVDEIKKQFRIKI